MTEQPKREAWDCLSQNQREATVAAVDPGGFIQEFGPSYNRFALRDLIAGINVALSTQAEELERVKGELRRLRGLGVAEHDHTNIDQCPTYYDGCNCLAKALEDAKGELAGLREALVLVLPMAKGYAAEHPVGNNAAMVQSADALLK